MIDKKAFDKIEGTQIRWLGNAGIMINSKGTNVMIDPLLEGFDMPLLIEMPMLPESVPFLDAVLVTHIDNDHFSRVTCRKLKEKCKGFMHHTMLHSRWKRNCKSMELDMEYTIRFK